jgi:hypothetical protein
VLEKEKQLKFRIASPREVFPLKMQLRKESNHDVIEQNNCPLEVKLKFTAVN